MKIKRIEMVIDKNGAHGIIYVKQNYRRKRIAITWDYDPDYGWQQGGAPSELLRRTNHLVQQLSNFAHDWHEEIRTDEPG